MPNLFGRSSLRYALFRWVLPRLGHEPLVNMNLAQRGWPMVSALTAQSRFPDEIESLAWNRDGDEDVTRVLNEYAQSSRPVVLRGYTAPWTFENVKRDVGETVVPIRVGDYASETGDPEVVKMRMADFVDSLTGKTEFPYKERLAEGIGPYLGNHVIPELTKQLPVPSFFDGSPVTSFWVGTDSVTPLHAHPMCDVLLVQLIGRRTVILIPPHQATLVGHVPRTAGICTAVFDPFKPAGQDSAGANVINCIHCELDAGDALLIPGFWFHAVRLAGPSLSGSQFNEAKMPLAIGGGSRTPWLDREFQRGWG